MSPVDQDTKELSFDDAFDLYANGVTPEVDKATEDTSTEDNATNTTDTTTSTTEVADETNDTAATTQENGHESSDSPATIEEAVAQAKLWEQRFKSYEGRVQAEMERRREEELMRQQQFISAMGTNKQQVQASPDENAAPPSKFKQLSQEFPEIAEAVQELLDQRFNDASGMVKRAIDERISPIAADMSQQKVSSHLERILTKHPDAIQLRQGGRLDSWINTLPVYAQHGARYVVNSGTADEVVALLDQYKVTTKNTNTNQNTAKPTQEDTGANRGPDQGMIEAVKAGLAVRPGRSSDPKTEATRSKKDDFDSGWEQALKDLGMN